MSSYYLFQGSSPSTRMSGRTMCLGTDWPLAGISQNVSVLCNICITYVMVGMQAEGRLSIVLCINVLHWMIMFRCGDALKELFFTPFDTWYLYARVAWTQGHLSTRHSEKGLCVSACVHH